MFALLEGGSSPPAVVPARDAVDPITLVRELEAFRAPLPSRSRTSLVHRPRNADDSTDHVRPPRNSPYLQMHVPNAIATCAPPLTLGRVVILVRDYDEALAFYQAAFAARVMFDAPSPSGDRYLHLGFGDPEDDTSQGAGIWLLAARGEDDARVGRQTGGQPLAVFYTTDVHGAVGRVRQAGGSVARPVASAGGSRFAHVNDLYGNEFVLVELVPDEA